VAFAWAQFFFGDVTTSAAPIFTVPVGHTYVIRDIELSNDPQPGDLLFLTDSLTGRSLLTVQVRLDGASTRWHGRAALVAGQTVEATMNTSFCGALITGYDLS